MNLSDIANSNIKSTDNCCIIKRNKKSEAINLMQNIIDLTRIGEHCKT